MALSPAYICLTRAGAEIARRLGGEIHGLRGRVDDADIVFDDTLAHLGELFAAGRAIVGICAAGILIRALGASLADKRNEPPVVALSPDGAFAIPLLGGHRGANDLARGIAAKLGGHAAITTAGDATFGVSLDEPPSGWRIEDEAAIKPVAAHLLAGGKVRIDGDGPFLAVLPQAPDATVTIRADAKAGGDGLIYRPATVALGIGAERNVATDEVVTLARRCLAESGLAEKSVACVVSLDLKSDETAILDLAATLGVPARFFDAATLAAETRITQGSEIVRAEVGTPSVAEAAALQAAGPDAKLVLPKRKSTRATCAIAMAPAPIDAAKIGRARGRLDIVGIGPGSPAWRTPEVDAVLRSAEEIVGYGLYLDLAADAIGAKPRHETGLGHETGRVETALALAAQGKHVALVCSGDAGIYALATLAYERREAGPAEWRRPEIFVRPGISALQAAAARSGAPLGHDFCAISLSDLLTQADAIERRLRAAADGDFVVALYNPASERRKRLLPLARDIFLAKRPPQTPVILARNLGRPTEAVEIVALGDDWIAKVDMLTLVTIGASTTRRVETPQGPRVFTPRGYADKDKP
jgi:cobalt-precorrin 5A hydrolase / precorrin-3B C17-methyltransferase